MTYDNFMENKNCLNCDNYCACLQDEDTFFHIHDYCKAWKTRIPLGYAAIETDDFVYNDIEEGISTCWLWEPKTHS